MLICGGIWEKMQRIITTSIILKHYVKFIILRQFNVASINIYILITAHIYIYSSKNGMNNLTVELMWN